MKTLYLAHSINSKPKVRKLQKEMESTFNIKFINPFYDGTSIENSPTTKSDEDILNFRNVITDEDCKEIVDEDINMINKCDGTLAIMSYPSPGTIMEIFWTSRVLNNPVYLFTNKYYSSHPWFRYLCSGIYIKKEDMFRDLRKIYGKFE